MPTDRPTPVEILQAIEGFLQDKVAPQVDRHTQFHLKVTANLLRLLQREWNQADALELDELARLQALLNSKSDDLTALNQQLCDAIRNQQLTLDDTALLEHLQQTTHAKLAIDNPRYLAGRFIPQRTA